MLLKTSLFCRVGLFLFHAQCPSEEIKKEWFRRTDPARLQKSSTAYILSLTEYVGVVVLVLGGFSAFLCFINVHEFILSFLRVGSIATSQLQGSLFAPELGLLTVWTAHAHGLLQCSLVSSCCPPVTLNCPPVSFCVCITPCNGLELYPGWFRDRPRIHYDPGWDKALAQDGWMNEQMKSTVNIYPDQMVRDTRLYIITNIMRRARLRKDARKGLVTRNWWVCLEEESRSCDWVLGLRIMLSSPLHELEVTKILFEEF